MTWERAWAFTGRWSLPHRHCRRARQRGDAVRRIDAEIIRAAAAHGQGEPTRKRSSRSSGSRYGDAVITRVRRAAAADIPPAARVLGCAFDEYPWTRWSIPADGYAQRLEGLQEIYLRHALRCGLVLVTEDVDGVVALLPPDAPAPPDVDQARIAELLGERLAVLVSAELPAAPPGSWELATLGVHPGSWGRGCGSALLAGALQEVDRAEARTVSLETSDPRNVALYERHGFDLTATTHIPDGPVVHWMVRTARRG